MSYMATVTQQITCRHKCCTVHPTATLSLSRHVLPVLSLLSFVLGPQTLSALPFATWQCTTKGAGSTPTSNWDADLFTDLEEYAFGSRPSSGVPERTDSPLPAGLTLDSTTTGTVSATVWITNTAEDVSLTLEESADLATWIPSSITPLNATEGIGLRRTWPEVSTSGTPRFVRLKLDHIGGGSVATPPLGWTSPTFAQETQTYSAAFLSQALYVGAVGSSGATFIDLPVQEARDWPTILTANRSYYVELMDGTGEGHRIAIDAGQTTSRRLALDLTNPMNTLSMLPSGLLGSRFAVRVRETLSDLCPKNLFFPATDESAADRVHRWQGTAWAIHWLRDFGSGVSHWVASTDPIHASCDNDLVDPVEGFLIERRQTTSVTIRETGSVPVSALRRRLLPGFSFEGSSTPLAQTPAQQGFTMANGHPASADSENSTQLLTWQGDLTPSATGWTTHWHLLFSAPPPTTRWIELEDSTFTPKDNTPFLLGSRAFYLHLPAAHPPSSHLTPPPTSVGTWMPAPNGLSDTDQDLLPDAWETLMVGSLTSAPSDDPDSDQLSNLEELRLGTNPTTAPSEPSSTFTLTVYRAGSSR